MGYSWSAVRFGQEHIGALVQNRYSLVTQQRGRVLGPAYQAHDHKESEEVFLKLFVRWPKQEVLQEALGRWVQWGQFSPDGTMEAWGPRKITLGRDNRGTFLVAPWIDGWSVNDRWTQDAEPSVAEMVNLLLSALEALNALHGQGLLHGGLRPSQILRRVEGSIALLRPGLDLFVAPTLQTDRDRWALTRAARAQTWAPEVRDFMDREDAPFPTTSADVFGFGRIIEAALDILPRNLGAPRERLRSVAQQCLRRDPDARPSIDDVVQQVDASVQRHRRPRASPPTSSGSGSVPLRGSVPSPGGEPSDLIPRRRRRPTGYREDPLPQAEVAQKEAGSTLDLDMDTVVVPPIVPSETEGEQIVITQPGDGLVDHPPLFDAPDAIPTAPPDLIEEDFLEPELPEPSERLATDQPPAGPDARFVEQEERPLPRRGGRRGPTSLAADLVPPPSPPDSLQKDWLEAVTFAQYGLVDHATRRLNEILRHDPTHRPAQALLTELTRTKNDPGSAGVIPPDDPFDGPKLVDTEVVDADVPWSNLDRPREPEARQDEKIDLDEGEPPPSADRIRLDGPAGFVPAFDENVQFTVYRPQHLVAKQWSDVLFFAHLSEKRPEAPSESPDPQAQVQRLAAGALGEAVHDYRTGTTDARSAIPRDGTLTIMPAVNGVTFNPPSASFVWSEDVHLTRFRARSDNPGQIHRGLISVFYGAVLVGDVPLALRVEPHDSVTPSSPIVPEDGRRYRRIFASYSRRDLPIVRSFEAFARGLGDRYLIDLLDLRAGEVWTDRLEEMIRTADVFQLFWSSNAMTSVYVLEEVQYALSLGHDIRPVFWEQPLPQDPHRNLPPPALARYHFQYLAPTATESPPSAGSAAGPKLGELPSPLTARTPGAPETSEPGAVRTSAPPTKVLPAPASDVSSSPTASRQVQAAPYGSGPFSIDRMPAAPARSGPSLLMTVLIAFGLSLLIVFLLMIAWFSL